MMLLLMWVRGRRIRDNATADIGVERLDGITVVIRVELQRVWTMLLLMLQSERVTDVCVLIPNPKHYTRTLILPIE